MGAKGAKPQVTTTETAYDPRTMAKWNQLQGQAGDIAQRQGQVAPGERVAGMTGAEETAGANFGTLASGQAAGYQNTVQAADALRGFGSLNVPQIDPSFAGVTGATGAQIAAVDPAQAVLAGPNAIPGGGGPATAVGARVGGPTETLRDVNAATGAAGMSAYANPYENQVVDQTISDIQRSGAEANVGVQAAAAKAGAFGGSRHGLVESENTKNMMEQIARTSGDLRARGFETAAGLGMSDADRGMAAGVANQGADVSRMQAGQQARIATGQNLTGASIASAQGANNYNLGMGQIGADVALGNARLGTEVNLANQDVDATRALAEGGFGQEAGLFTAGAENTGAMFNAGEANAAAASNAQNYLTGRGQGITAASNLGNLGLGQDAATLGANESLLGFGGMQRGVDQAMKDFGYTQDMDLLNWKAGILGSAPVNETQTNTKPMERGGWLQGIAGITGTVLGGPIGGMIAGKLMGGK